MTAFDIFIIRQWRECYTLEVKCSRPGNAPRYKFSKADFKRMHAANAKNRELLEKQFATLDEVMEEIKRLQFPHERKKTDED